jgi:hypothetical protein
MSDRELAVQAISEAQRILEEYLEPKHHDNETLLDRLGCSRPPRVATCGNSTMPPKVLAER